MKKDTLFIIGNGFDIWQGLDSSYTQFEKYYHAHLDEILKKLHLKKRTLFDEHRKPVQFSDVELFYGDPYQPGYLPHNFWNTFEASLDKLDDQQLNLYFGKDARGLREIKKGVQNAQRILGKAFCDWVGTIKINKQDAGYRFGDNCLFINFNYTDTLLKRFGVQESDEFHIHGEAYDKKSIIFGHSTHPEYPLESLRRLRGRLRGLYFVEEALYQTDKHVEDNYTLLRMFLAFHGASAQDIKNIYVLGHSFGDADLDYFKHIINTTQGTEEPPEVILSAQEQEYLEQLDSEEEIFLNFQYAVHHRERMLKKKPISYPLLEKLDEIIYDGMEDPYFHMPQEQQFRLETAVVRHRFWCEQADRDRQVEKDFFKLLRRPRLKKPYSIQVQPSADRVSVPVANNDVQWHISYFSPEDKTKIDTAMAQLGCKKYTLYPSIDKCLQPFMQSVTSR